MAVTKRSVGVFVALVFVCSIGLEKAAETRR
jgi:hypothetical protein